jgi:molybdate transport system regulatory protein
MTPPTRRPTLLDRTNPQPKVTVRPRIRIFRGEVIAFGPGKADLLEAIQRSGSIRKAADSLRMSYMRAWHLVQTMNGEFRAPVISTIRGGEGHGGAVVTETGEAVLDLYRKMEAASARAMAPAWRRLRSHLRR